MTNKIHRVGIITGSTRPRRISRQVSERIMTIAAALPTVGATFEMELVDLAEWNLPMLDEPNIPAYGQYAHEHTRAWSRAVASYDGFVFVTPQYNWGYPAPLKNALDYLYTEWNGKPAVIISYGFHGGAKAAVQLRQVLEGLKMFPTATMPEITLTREMYGEDGLLIDVGDSLAPYIPTLQTAFEELAVLLKAK